MELQATLSGLHPSIRPSIQTWPGRPLPPLRLLSFIPYRAGPEERSQSGSPRRRCPFSHHSLHSCEGDNNARGVLSYSEKYPSTSKFCVLKLLKIPIFSSNRWNIFWKKQKKEKNHQDFGFHGDEMLLLLTWSQPLMESHVDFVFTSS